MEPRGEVGASDPRIQQTLNSSLRQPARNLGHWTGQALPRNPILVCAKKQSRRRQVDRSRHPLSVRRDAILSAQDRELLLEGEVRDAGGAALGQPGHNGLVQETQSKTVTMVVPLTERSPNLFRHREILLQQALGHGQQMVEILCQEPRMES